MKLLFFRIFHCSHQLMFTQSVVIIDYHIHPENVKPWQKCNHLIQVN